MYSIVLQSSTFKHKIWHTQKTLPTALRVFWFDFENSFRTFEANITAIPWKRAPVLFWRLLFSTLGGVMDEVMCFRRNTNTFQECNLLNAVVFISPQHILSKVFNRRGKLFMLRPAVGLRFIPESQIHISIWEFRRLAQFATCCNLFAYWFCGYQNVFWCKNVLKD